MSSKIYRLLRETGTLAVLLGPAATIVYVALATMAYSAYPTTFGLTNNNWLSDLGNRDLNPGGANFYVWGCIATGALVLGFFAALGGWKATGRRIQNYLLVFVQIAGAVGASSLIMSAIYTEDQFSTHQFWSRLIYAGFAVALFVSPFAFRRRRRSLVPLITVAILGYSSIVASLIFAQARWLEWPAIGCLLAYLWVLAWMTRAEMARSRADLGRAISAENG